MRRPNWRHTHLAWAGPHGPGALTGYIDGLAMPWPQSLVVSPPPPRARISVSVCRQLARSATLDTVFALYADLIFPLPWAQCLLGFVFGSRLGLGLGLALSLARSVTWRQVWRVIKSQKVHKVEGRRKSEGKEELKWLLPAFWFLGVNSQSSSTAKGDRMAESLMHLR